MKIRNFNKKSAFTLMELSICILILSILVLLTIPTVVKQMKKSDEYSYYLAYKTVERLGTQIVAFGDPNDEQAFINDNKKIAKQSSKSKFISLLDHFIGKISPKAYADPKIYEILSWPSYEYDIVSLCNRFGVINETYKIVKDYNGEYTYFSRYDVLGNNYKFSNNTAICDYYRMRKDSDGDGAPTGTGLANIRARFIPKPCQNILTNAELEEAFLNQSPENFCMLLDACKSGQANIVAEWNPLAHSTTDNTMESRPYGECRFTYRGLKDTASSSTVLTNQDTHKDPIDCEDFGYKNFTTLTDSNGGFRGCNCLGSLAINNNKVCCGLSIPSGRVAYYDEKNDTCVTSIADKYNFSTGTNCPDYSTYSEATKACVCNDGYSVNNSGECVSDSASCQSGYQLKNGVCVANPQITRAERFCELIKENWNIAQANCGGEFSDAEFTEDIDGIQYYSSVAEAVTNPSGRANDTGYLSVVPKEGVSFNDIAPNIVFSNGLKLWILSDKVASIPGLTFNPADYGIGAAGVMNACQLQETNNETICNSYHKDNDVQKSYYCKYERNCYIVKTSDSEKSYLEDARNCCISPDFTDYANKYQNYGYLSKHVAYAISGFTIFVDINGNKGHGILWEDVYPFYISSTGQVYPGYPLNAPGDSQALYVGGNSNALSSDVYYYTIDGSQRKRVSAYSAIPYARAMCFSKSISPYSPYCMNLGESFLPQKPSIGGWPYFINKACGDSDTEGIDCNPCAKHKCYVHVKNKIKIL